MILINTNSHFRFEPYVDGGTAYAFNYGTPELITGRAPMFFLLEFIQKESPPSIAAILDHCVGDDHSKYKEVKDVLIDISRLSNCNVIRVS